MRIADIAQDLRPDVIVLDRHMEPASVDSALPILRAAAPAAAIVVYSAFTADRQDLLDAGADAVVDEASLSADLETAIREAADARRT